jgi:hypothetical protein
MHLEWGRISPLPKGSWWGQLKGQILAICCRMSQHNWVKKKQGTKGVKGMKATNQCSNVQPDNFIAFPSLDHDNFTTL